MGNSAIRIKTGHVTVANINADSAALLQNFTMQSDMGANAAFWNANCTAPEFESIRETDSDGELTNGYLTCAITFQVMTYGMIAYFRTTFYASSRRPNITVKVFDEEDVAFYIQGKLVLPKWGSEYRSNRIAIGYKDVVWGIVHGTEIT